MLQDTYLTYLGELQVLLDGRDIRSVPLEWLRSHMGLVSQEPVLFACSLRDNIMYGRPGSSQEELEAAARAAYAHDFIMSFPDGYVTCRRCLPALCHPYSCCRQTPSSNAY